VLDWLRGLFGGARGGAPTSADGGIYVTVQCDACGEHIRARISPTSELSLADDGQGYFVRKVLVGKQCFRSIEVLLRYSDLKGTEISREVHGGTSVS
jgi:hypothetical protein